MELRASLSAEIAASAARVYGILADYRGGHAQILPRDFFHNLTVISGGTGAGTELSVQAVMFGRVRLLRMKVTEPEPGRVLAETDIDTGMATSFTVDSSGADSCTVTIATAWQSQRGFTGLMERWLVPPTLRKVFRQELALLARFLAESTGA